MRTIAVQIWANNGVGTLSGPCDVSSTLAELGKISWAVDARFTKSSPGQLTAGIWDPDETVWSWFLTQIPTVRDGASQLLRPWITVTADGVRKFTGLLDLQSIRQGSDGSQVDISADDWSALLQDVVLEGDAWQRSYPKGTTTRAQQGPFAASRTTDMDPAVVTFEDTPDMQVGDSLQQVAGGAVYPVVSITQEGVFDIKGRLEVTRVYVRLTGWNATGTGSYSFNRLANTTADLSAYTVTRAIAPTDQVPVYRVQLDTTDQIYPGDVLKTASGTEIPVGDVDAERSEVISWDPIKTDLAVGDKLTWSDETKAQLMYQDAGEIIQRAVAPYAVDLSRFTPGVIPRQILAWLPVRRDGITLRQVTELEPTLTHIRLLGVSGAWTGSPDTGWTEGAVGTKYADWTTQLAAAPPSLMPDDRATIPGLSRFRNRVYYQWTYHPPVMVRNDGSIPDEPIYTPPQVPWPAIVYAYDYARLRRLVLQNPSTRTDVAASLEEARWTGSAWSATTATAWPVAGYYPVSLVPMTGVAATSGPVAPQGQALLALSISNIGETCQLQLVHAGAPVILEVTQAGSELVGTPWGVFLVGPGGYGRVRYQGGALSVNWVTILDPSSGLVPSTLVALDADSIFILAKFSAQSGQGADSKDVSTTGLLNLTADPDPADPASAILFRETACDGWPAIAQAVRDPSDPTRILGLLGSRFFQVSNRLPRTIERLKAAGMTATDLLENLALMENAIVVSRPDATLAFVSRSSMGSAVPLTVNRYNVRTSRVSKFFFSAVRVTGANDDLFADAFGAVRGGTTLEISSHPFLWTEGGCFGVASSYVDFCGKPRQLESQDWFFEDASTDAPWEDLVGWTSVVVNGGPTWILTELSYDLFKGDANAVLLEVVL